LGLVVVYLRFPYPFLFVFGYTAAFVLLLAFAHDFLVGAFKLSRKKALLLTLGVIAVAAAVTQSVWTLVSPSWSFSVSTYKSSFGLGEAVEVRVMLKNLGFIKHSFKSLLSDPVLIGIDYVHPENPTATNQVWYSPIHASITEFSIEPKEALERSFIWNQTNVHFPENEIGPGNYRIIAFIPNDDPDEGIHYNYLFYAWSTFTITSV